MQVTLPSLLHSTSLDQTAAQWHALACFPAGSPTHAFQAAITGSHHCQSVVTVPLYANIKTSETSRKTYDNILNPPPLLKLCVDLAISRPPECCTYVKISLAQSLIITANTATLSQNSTTIGELSYESRLP